MEETLIERGGEKRASPFGSWLKRTYGELDLKHLSITVVFPALLLTIKIALKTTIKIVLKVALKSTLKTLYS